MSDSEELLKVEKEKYENEMEKLQMQIEKKIETAKEQALQFEKYKQNSDLKLRYFIMFFFYLSLLER